MPREENVLAHEAHIRRVGIRCHCGLVELAGSLSDPQ
jgi:hypothetical protein